MSAFRLRIVTPQEEFPEREVEALDVPGWEGRLTILARHAPLICALREGEARMAVNGAWERWRLAAGVLRAQPDGVWLLVSEARREN